jgi:hypothetical protein
MIFDVFLFLLNVPEKHCLVHRNWINLVHCSVPFAANTESFPFAANIENKTYDSFQKNAFRQTVQEQWSELMLLEIRVTDIEFLQRLAGVRNEALN